MKYCAFVKDEEFQHSAIAANDPRYNTKRPVDMQKAIQDFYNTYKGPIRKMSWETLKAAFDRFIQGMIGGTGATEIMKSDAYKAEVQELRAKWERARGIRKNSWG